MRKWKALGAPLLVLVALIGSAQPRVLEAGPADPDPDSIIDRVLETYGGAEAVRAVDSHRQEGMLVAVRGGAPGQV
ncbi:MAG: hypothetical protein ABFR65_13590, partial [Pseudomonadota bacterium]